MQRLSCTVTFNAEIMTGVHLMWIEAPDIADGAQPGQFVTVQCNDLTLRRPFSIHRVSSREIALLFKITGKGTLWLSRRKKGDPLDILGPLGNGFTISPSTANLLLVAGGIGIAPLVFLMQRALPHHQITLIDGASTAASLYPFSGSDKKRTRVASLPDQVKYVPVTEDGSAGYKGKATDVLPDFLNWADQVYACGPLDMYKAMALQLNASQLEGGGKGQGGRQSNLKLSRCQVSLEVRMGCGFGACYGCSITTKKGLRRVCRDGPVFDLDDIFWQEVRI